LGVVLLVLGAPPLALADDQAPSASRIHDAIEKALPILEKGASGYIEQRDCFSCHHQALPVLAFTLGKARKLVVNEETLREQVIYTEDALAGAANGYRKGDGLPGGVTTAGYLLWTLEMAGSKPDDGTSAVTDYLLRRDESRDHWNGTGGRPPSEGSPFTSTYLAVRALLKFAPADQRDRVKTRLDAVREWLIRTPADDTESRVFRLWALSLIEANAEEIAKAKTQLIATQRDDGGWPQIPSLESDAYATGSALLVLHEAGGVSSADPIYRKGLEFLLKTQRPDGSWYVKSRSKPFQIYFESGFPHGKDQFISIAATGWATSALILACE
jgi:hypothetical protein